ncbi:MAG: tripartite tricarboxylate transporter substrate-binding protein [Burkholderiaceae bacterium]
MALLTLHRAAPAHRLRRRAALLVLGALGSLGALAAAGRVHAQMRFPDRPITLIVPFAPGGIADLTARAIAGPLAQALGQPVVVENRPSAGGIVASQAVAGARPDGHTLLLMSNANALSATLFKKLPYDTVRDFAPISTLGFFDLGVFVNAWPGPARFASLGDALAYAKAQPGKLTIGSINVGSTQNLAAELFRSLAGIDALIVPYKSSPAVLTALRSGEIDLAFEILGAVLAQVSAGAVRALAVSSDARNPALPDVPTVQQAVGLRYAVASWNALAAPAATAADVVATLNRAVRESLAAPATMQALGKLGMRLQASTPAELAQLLARDIDRWGGVIRAAKIEPE